MPILQHMFHRTRAGRHEESKSKSKRVSKSQSSESSISHSSLFFLADSFQRRFHLFGLRLAALCSLWLKRPCFRVLVKNTYLTRRPPARVLINVYRGFVFKKNSPPWPVQISQFMP